MSLKISHTYFHRNKAPRTMGWSPSVITPLCFQIASKSPESHWLKDTKRPETNFSCLLHVRQDDNLQTLNGKSCILNINPRLKTLNINWQFSYCWFIRHHLHCATFCRQKAFTCICHCMQDVFHSAMAHKRWPSVPAVFPLQTLIWNV